jgi:hypothetical protein
MELEGSRKKRMGATYVGVRRAHPYSWSLSSPQQPLETEDSPTVSLAPQYTSQRLCRAIDHSLKDGFASFYLGLGEAVSRRTGPAKLQVQRE